VNSLLRFLITFFLSFRFMLTLLGRSFRKNYIDKLDAAEIGLRIRMVFALLAAAEADGRERFSIGQKNLSWKIEAHLGVGDPGHWVLETYSVLGVTIGFYLIICCGLG